VAEGQAEEVTFSKLLSSADKLDGSLVRLIAPCNIAFEGNAVHAPDVPMESLRAKRIWLELGWPVSAEIRALNHKYVLVEGRFDLGAKGHQGMYEGTIKDIRRIEESSPEAEREVERRLGGAR
jgi:hypothetical protein